jgi:hypothetical protein
MMDDDDDDDECGVGRMVGRRNRSAQRNVRCEVFTAVTMTNGVFWDVTPCSSCKTDV